MFRRDERPSVSGVGAIRFPRSQKADASIFDVASMLSLGLVVGLFVILLFLYGAPTGVALDTPSSDETTPIPIPDWKIAIDSSGILYFENRAMDLESLTALITQRKLDRPEATNALLFLDRSTRIDQFSKVGVALRKLGISVYYHIRETRAQIPSLRPGDR